MLKRMWINQPSTAQPLHKLHGTLVLGHDDGDACTRIYFLKGPTIDMRVMNSCVSDGWPDHLTK
jgi:hypothetical protein